MEGGVISNEHKPKDGQSGKRPSSDELGSSLKKQCWPCSDSASAFHPPQGPWDFYLPCRPDTVTWGYIDANVAPRLCVKSGAQVRVDTVNGAPEVMPVTMRESWHIPSELFDIYEKVKERVNPGHILTGPIHIEEAMPGDVLQVDILEVTLRSNCAWTRTKAYGGCLQLGEKAHLRHTVLEPSKTSSSGGWARPPWGGKLALSPFFGVMGVAPPKDFGRQSSIPPRDYGGNLDIKDLTAGTTLYLPVQEVGALFFVGDGHARQADGECCGTALETSLSGVFRFSVLKQGRVAPVGLPELMKRPRAENSKQIMTIACHYSFDEAAKLALSDMLDWLAERCPKLHRMDAYMLLTAIGNIRVSQLVNFPTKGCHVVVEKSEIPDL